MREYHSLISTPLWSETRSDQKLAPSSVQRRFLNISAADQMGALACRVAVDGFSLARCGWLANALLEAGTHTSSLTKHHLFFNAALQLSA